MQGAAEVVQGVFMGGFEEARSGIRAGSKQADQFRYEEKECHTHFSQPTTLITCATWCR